jgi:hypothetical protein
MSEPTDEDIDNRYTFWMNVSKHRLVGCFTEIAAGYTMGPANHPGPLLPCDVSIEGDCGEYFIVKIVMPNYYPYQENQWKDDYGYVDE